MSYPFGIRISGVGGGNLRVILVRACGPVFRNLPQSYAFEKDIYSYTSLNKMFTYSSTVGSAVAQW